jgi:hypothetical protein
MPTPATRVTGTVTRPIPVDRILSATITTMSVLIVYDGWQHVKLIDGIGVIVGVIVGPVVAMFLAHVSSAALAKQVEVGRALTWDDRTGLVGSELEGLSLGCRGHLAARRAEVVGWHVPAHVAGGQAI